jgi:hypothetical protein
MIGTRAQLVQFRCRYNQMFFVRSWIFAPYSRD